MQTPNFTPGRNIAIKVPPHAYDATLAFYRDVIGLKQLTGSQKEIGFRFGDKSLWIDRVPTISQAEVWLEIESDDLSAAAEHFRKHGVIRCDEIEPLPPGFKGFWIMSPASIVHLVCEAEQTQAR
jgi:catechol 2,3-dioxygenase-like lactoylglutathione lyase family enzyme